MFSFSRPQKPLRLDIFGAPGVGATWTVTSEGPDGTPCLRYDTENFTGTITEMAASGAGLAAGARGRVARSAGGIGPMTRRNQDPVGIRSAFSLRVFLQDDLAYPYPFLWFLLESRICSFHFQAPFG